MTSRPGGPSLLYLDVDGVLLRDVPPPGTGPEARAWPRDAAPGAAEFLHWAVDRFRVRWLTAWAPDGELTGADAERLARLLGVRPALLRSIQGTPWSGTKLDGIDFLEPRPWWWVDDRVSEAELRVLRMLKREDRWIECRSDRDPGALERVRKRLESRSSGRSL